MTKAVVPAVIARMKLSKLLCKLRADVEFNKNLDYVLYPRVEGKGKRANLKYKLQKAYAPIGRFLQLLELLHGREVLLSRCTIRKISYVLRGIRRRCPLNWIPRVSRTVRKWREWLARFRHVTHKRAHFGRRERPLLEDYLYATPSKLLLAVLLRRTRRKTT